MICDAKRGDIGPTAEAYAAAYLAGEDPEAAAFAADAVTVNPYLGTDTLDPFVRLARQRGAGVYVLVRTSNPGAGAFQDLASKAGTLYQQVAAAVEGLAASTADADRYGCVGAVIGATYPRELRELRAMMPHVPLLLPGFGVQGGTLPTSPRPSMKTVLADWSTMPAESISPTLREPYRSTFGDDKWEQAVEAATKDMIAELNRYTPVGQLG